MSTPRAVFVDIDGTLVNDLGEVPDSARRAIAEARSRGHLVFVCTGRSVPEIWPEILQIGFDGVIAGSGTHVEAGGVVLARRQLSRPDVQHVIDFFGSNGVHFYFQGSDGVFASRELRSHLGRVIRRSVTDEDMLAELERGLVRFIQAIKVDADPFDAEIDKVAFIDSPLPIEEIRREFAASFDVVPSSIPIFGPDSGEMLLSGVHKATGIDVVLDHLGIDRADSIALGDSFNDLEMLAHAGVGIAMGNAPADVQAVADEVTEDVGDDGLARAFARHGLASDRWTD